MAAGDLRRLVLRRTRAALAGCDWSVELAARTGFADLVRCGRAERRDAHLRDDAEARHARSRRRVSSPSTSTCCSIRSGCRSTRRWCSPRAKPGWPRKLAAGYVGAHPVHRLGRPRRFPEERGDHVGTAGRVADRIRRVAARSDRLRVPVRLADPADGGAGGRLGADAPRIPRAAAQRTRVTRPTSLGFGVHALSGARPAQQNETTPTLTTLAALRGGAVSALRAAGRALTCADSVRPSSSHVRARAARAAAPCRWSSSAARR